MLAGRWLAFGVDMFLDAGIHGDNLLKSSHSMEPQHRVLPSSESQMALVDPI